MTDKPDENGDRQPASQFWRRLVLGRLLFVIPACAAFYFMWKYADRGGPALWIALGAFLASFVCGMMVGRPRLLGKFRLADAPPGIAAGDARELSTDALLRRTVARRPLLVSLLVLGAFAAGTLILFTPRYETNDDVGMNAAVAGRLAYSRPDEHVLFSNVLIGRVLKGCYGIFPNVPWYGGYLVLTAALSLAAICFVGFSQQGSEWNWILIGTFLLLAGIPLLVDVQFTRVAIGAALAGLLLLVGSIRLERIGWQKWLAVPFLVVAGLIRFEALLLACLVLSPMIAWMFWRTNYQVHAWAPCLLLVACLAVGFAAHRYNVWYYERDPGWQEFHRFNALRTEFTDMDHVEYTPETAPVFASVGWLPIDLQMLQNWVFLDRDRYNVETLQTVLDRLAPFGRKHTKPLNALFSGLIEDGELLGLWAFGAACLAILASDKSARFVPLACYCVTAVVCILLYRYLRLPARVYCPAFAACSIVPIVFSAGPRASGRRRLWTESSFGRRAALLLVGAVIVWRGSAMWQSNVDFVSDHRQAATMLKQLSPQANQLFVVWAASFPYEYLALPLDGNSMPRAFKVLGLDAGSQTPPARSRMDEFGVTDMLSIARRGNGTYLICERWPANILRVYLNEHYGVKAVFYLAFANPALGASAVWQIRISEHEPPSP